MKKKLFIVSAAIFALSAYCLAAEPAPCEGLNPHKPYLENFESYGATVTSSLTSTKGYEVSPSWWEKALTPTCWTVGNEKLGTNPSVCTSSDRAYFPYIFSNGSVTVNTTTGVVTKTNYYDKGMALTTEKYSPEGHNALKMNAHTSYGIVWAALPELKGSDEDISSLVISASARFTKATATIPHALIVGIMEDPTDLSTFVVLDSIATGVGVSATNPAQKIEVTVANKGYTGKGRYVAFRTAYRPNATSGTYKVCATTVFLDSVALRVEPFYAQNNWETESDWSWKQMAKTAENIYKVDSVVFGGLGINFNDTADTPDATWVAASDFKGDAVQAKDTVSFTYNTSTKEVTMTLIGRPAAPVVPQIVVVYDMQGHGEAIENDTIESGSKITQPAKPEAVGYEFRGWYSNAKGLGEAFDFSKTVTATKDSTITLYAKWRDPVAWEQFKKDLDAYSYVEYDSTYEAGFMIHLATTQDAQVQPLTDAAFIEASEEVLANYDFGTFIITIVSLYPAMSDELGKCMGIEDAPIRRKPKQDTMLTLISAYTQLPYRVDGLNAVCGLYTSYVDLVYKAWLETNYENDADICKCMFNSDVFFKGSAKLREAFDVCEK